MMEHFQCPKVKRTDQINIIPVPAVIVIDRICLVHDFVVEIVPLQNQMSQLQLREKTSQR